MANIKNLKNGEFGVRDETRACNLHQIEVEFPGSCWNAGKNSHGSTRQAPLQKKALEDTTPMVRLEQYNTTTKRLQYL